MDRLQAITVFLEIAERGSLTRAAEALSLSQPSVVRTLAALERHLGVRLFNRNTRRLAITEEGRAYREHALAIRSAVLQSEQAMHQSRGEPSGSLTLTASVKLGELHVAPLVASYLQRYPQVNVQLLLLDRLVNLVDEGIDLAVRIAHLPDSSLIARHVTDVHQVIAVSPKLLAECGRPLQPQALAERPCIGFDGFGASGVWEFDNEGKRDRVKIRARLHCNTIGANLAACVAGLGFGRFLHYQVLNALATGELIQVLPEFAPASRPMSLVHPSNRHGSTRLSTLVEHLSLHLPQRLRLIASNAAAK